MSLTKGRNNLKLKELDVTNGETGQTVGLICSYTKVKLSF